MRALSLAPFARLAGLAPLAVRLIVGILITVHGFQKLAQGPANFGEQTLTGLGIPLPVLMGYVVTFAEIIGGILLIVGLLSRLAALVLIIDLAVAILLVKVNIGFIVPHSSGAGVEIDLAYIAGFLVILLAGPGKLSLDYALGLDRDPMTEGTTTGGDQARSA